MFSGDSAVLYEKKNRIGIVKINRPHRMNAISVEVFQKLEKIWDSVDEDNEVDVIILTGVGDRAFCAGMDLKEQAELSAKGEDILQYFNDNYMLKMNSVKKPIIVAVNGVAAAGGFQLVQNADLRVASQDVQFSIREAKVGRGSPWAVPLLSMMPMNVAMELTMMAEPISADRMYEVGFLNRIAPEGKALEVAIEMAEIIRENAPLSVMAAKQSLKEAMEFGKSLAEKNAAKVYEKVYSSEDAIEGPRAFAEKRKPVWKGK